jgi:hypothetical protein
VITLSGQVRSASRTGSTSSAKGRYRPIGIDDPRWVFHAGWPVLGWPAGLVIVRADLNMSGESSDGREKLVTMIAPGNEKGRLNGGDRRVANTRDGRPV